MKPPAAVLVLALAAVACGRGEPAREGSAPAAATSAPPTRPALATADVKDTPLVVELYGVERKSAGVLEIRLALVNRSAAPFDIGATLAARPGDARSVSGVSVYATDGASRVLVLRDEQGKPQCSRDVAPIAPGERRELEARTLPPGGASVTAVLVDVPGAGRLGPIAIAPAPAPR